MYEYFKNGLSSYLIKKNKSQDLSNYTYGDWQDNGDNEIRYANENSNIFQTQPHSYSISQDGNYQVSTCSSCGAVRRELVGHTHNWLYRQRTVGTKDVCWTEYEECSICNEKRNIVNHEHNFVEQDDGWGGMEISCSRCHRYADE